TSSNSGLRRFGQSGQNPVAGSRSTGRENNSPSRPEMRGNSSGSTSARDRGNSNGGGWQRFSPMAPRSSSESARPGASGTRPYMGGREDRGSYGSPRSSGPASR